MPTKRIKVLLTDNISASVRELLQEHNEFDVDVAPSLPAGQLRAALQGYEAIVVRSATRLNAALLGEANGLRIVVRGGVGIDNIDLRAATECGIAVANTPSANSVATAELTFALMLALARNLVAAQASLAQGEWRRAAFVGEELAAKVLGIIGFGRVGQEVARRARAFDMRVIANDPYVSETTFRAAGVERLAFFDLLAEADYITLHIPLNEETANLIDEKAIAHMKQGVRLINCARGGLLDEQAVKAGLQQGKIAGVALDVYRQEPPGADETLIGLPNVLAVPHLGASTREAQEKIGKEVAQTLINFFIFKRIDANIINREELHAKSHENGANSDC